MNDQNEHSDLRSLIRSMEGWSDQVGPLDWVGHVGSYESAIGYSLMFWPNFVVIGDYVLREGSSVENVRSWEKATDHNRTAIEAVINHVHLADIHDGEPTEAQLRHLGRVLKSVHEAKLKLDFPDREFVVSFPDEPGLDLLDYEITFWQAPD